MIWKFEIENFDLKILIWKFWFENFDLKILIWKYLMICNLSKLLVEFHLIYYQTCYCYTVSVKFHRSQVAIFINSVRIFQLYLSTQIRSNFLSKEGNYTFHCQMRFFLGTNPSEESKTISKKRKLYEIKLVKLLVPFIFTSRWPVPV